MEDARYCGQRSNVKKMKIDGSFQITDQHFHLFFYLCDTLNTCQVI